MYRIWYIDLEYDVSIELTNPLWKYDFVNWDDDIPDMSGKKKYKKKTCSSHHQPDWLFYHNDIVRNITNMDNLYG